MILVSGKVWFVEKFARGHPKGTCQMRVSCVFHLVWEDIRTRKAPNLVSKSYRLVPDEHFDAVSSMSTMLSSMLSEECPIPNWTEFLFSASYWRINVTIKRQHFCCLLTLNKLCIVCNVKVTFYLAETLAAYCLWHSWDTKIHLITPVVCLFRQSMVPREDNNSQKLQHFVVFNWNVETVLVSCGI